MAYGSGLMDVVQSSTAGTPPQFNDGNSTQIGTLCRAWVNFNGVTTATIRASFNVSSVTRNGTGYYTVNFTTALPDANYAPNVNVCSEFGTRYGIGASLYSGGSPFTEVAPTTSAFSFTTLNGNTAAFDPKYVQVSVFR